MGIVGNWMGRFIVACGFMIRSRGWGSKFGMTRRVMRGSFMIIRNMERVTLRGPMAIVIKAISLMIRNMAKESITGQMVVSIRVLGFSI